MKIDIDGFEIEIKAKYHAEDRNSKRAALSFLNTLSILYGDSAELHRKTQDPVYVRFAELQEKRSKQLFDICNKNGLYDEY